MIPSVSSPAVARTRRHGVNSSPRRRASRFLSPGAVATAAASLALLLPHAALAQTFTWNGTTGNWTDGPSWVGGTAPPDGGLAGIVLNFTGTGTAFNAFNNFPTQPFVLTTMNLSNTVTGNVVRGGVINFQTGPGAVAPSIIQNGAGGFTLGLDNTTILKLDADTTVAGTGNGQISILGLITGAGGLIKTSSNTLALNNTGSAYTGATSTANGTLRFLGSVGVNTNSAFGNSASAVVVGTAATVGTASPVLIYSSAANGTFDRPFDLSQAPGVTTGQGGRSNLVMDSSATGVIPGQGTTTTTLLGNNPNTWTINGPVTIGSTSGTAGTSLARRAAFAAVQYNSKILVNGLVSGTTSGGIFVNGDQRGAGTVQFTNAANSWTGLGTLGNGTLLIGTDVTSAAGAASILGASLNWNVADGGTVAGNQTISGGLGILSNPRVLVDGAYSNNRIWGINNGATFSLNNVIGDGSVNSYTFGSTANNTGTARFTGAITAPFLATNQNINLTTGGAGTVAFDGAIGINTSVGAMNLNINQNINPQTGQPGAVSTGTVQLNAANAYDGSTNIVGGTLVLGNNTALGRTGGGATVASLNVFNAGGTAQGQVGTSGTPTIVNYGGAQVASGATLDLNGKAVGAEAITLNGGALVNNSATAATLNATGGLPSLALTGIGTAQNYAAAPTVAITGGGGTGAAAVARLNVATIAVPTGGTGYSAATKVFASFAGGAAVNATDSVQNGFNAIPVITGGVITGVTIRLAGGNLTATPVITFVDSAATPGTGATATATSYVTGLDFTNSGTGYTSTPTVALSSGDATVAASPVLVNFAQSSSVGGSGNLSVGGVVGGAVGATVTKVGAGTLTLGAVNTYSGPTVVQAGILNVTGSIAASSGLTITGGTVAGTGALPGIALQTGGRLLAGPTTGTGTLSATSLTFDGGATLAFMLGADPTVTGASDRLSLSGAFNKGASAGVFNFDFAGSSASLSVASPYTLVSFAPGGTNFTAGDVAGFGVSNLPAGYAGTFTLDSAAGALRLNVAAVAVPEPGSVALLLAAGLPVAGLAAARRRRAARQA